MKKQLMTGATLLALAMATSQTMAGSGSGRFMHFFDTNKDDMVTMEEFNAAAAERFKKMDADGNAVISQDEFRAYRDARQQERKDSRFTRMDSNGNGTVERDEYLAYKQKKAERGFTRMDKNADGVVSKEEFSSCRKHKKGGHGSMFERMDENKDGQVTQQESLTAWKNWFVRIDANKDQVVSADEVKAYRDRLHGERAGSK